MDGRRSVLSTAARFLAAWILVGSGPAAAATFWWNTTATGLWSAGANWDNAASGGTAGVAPATTDDVVFNRTATNGNEVVALDANTTINGITFSNRGATTIRSSTSTTRTLTLGAGGLSLGSAAGPATLSVSGTVVNIALDASQSWTNNASPVSSSLTVAGGITAVSGARTLTIDGVGATTLSGNITDGGGSVALTKSGAGTLTLSGANTYTGNTAIDAGTVVINATSSLSGATTAGRYSVAAGATLAVNNGVTDADVGNIVATGNFSANSAFGFNTAAGARTYASAIAGSIGLTKLGANTLTLSGSSTYSGTTSVRGGTLQLTTLAGGRLGSTAGLVVSDATLLVGDSTAANNDGVVNRINSAAALTLGATSGSSTFTLGFSTTTHAQTLASLTSNFGRNTISVSGATGANTLTFTGEGGGGYARATGGYLNVATQAGFSVAFTNDPTAAGGVAGSGSDKILVGATINGNDLVGLSGAGPYTTGTALYVNSSTTTWTAGKNMNVTGSINVGSATNVNSIRFAENSNRTVTLTGTSIIDSGMILMASTGITATTPGTVAGGTITSGNGKDLVVIDQRSVGNRDLTPAFVISSVIADNGATPIAVTLVGNNNGMVRLSGANSYSGGTNLIGANLRITSDGNLGAVPGSAQTNIRAVGTSQIGVGQTGTVSLHANRGSDFNGQLTLDPQYASTNGVLEINGVIAGSGTAKTSDNRAGLLILNGSNTFAGQITLTNASLRAADGVGLPANAALAFEGHLNNGNGYNNPGNFLETNGTFTRTIGSSAGQVRWNTSVTNYGAGGFSAVGGPLTVALGGTAAPASVTWGGATLYLQSANATHELTWVNPVNPNGGTLRIGVLSTTYAANVSGVMSGSGTLRITDGGRLTLSGSNTFSGKTQIYNGTLNVASLNRVSGGSANSNLGAPSNASNGTIDLGGNQNIYGSGVYDTATVQATLRYTGSGETTDRVLNVTGIAGEGGSVSVPATVEHAGSGLLAFASGITVAAGGARSLTLQGSTSGTGEIAGAIPDAYTATTLTVSANSAATSIKIPTTASVGVGDRVAGVGIPADTVVSSVTGDNNAQYIVNLSKALSSAMSSGAAVTFTNVTNLSKAGTGLWVLSGTNTYSGTTTVSSGTLQIGGAGLLGSGSHARPISVASGATLDYASSATQEISGTISGNGVVRMSGGGVLTLSGSNSYAGGTTIISGTLRAGASGASFGAGAVTLSGGVLDLNGRGDIANAVTLTGGSLVGGSLNVSQVTATSGTVTAGLTGVGGLTKSAAGRLVLAGSNSYLGTTTVNAGQLVVNGSLDGGVSVGAGGTLMGAGTIGGNTTISGLHSPGNSPAIQTITGNLEYLSGASVLWELTGNTTTNAANPNAVYDQIVVGGDLTFSGTTTLSLSFDIAGSTVNWTDGFWGANRSWTLYDLGTGTTSGFASFFTLAGSPSTWLDTQGTPQSLALARPGSSFTLSLSGQDVMLNYVVASVPEPGTLALAGIGIAGACWTFRRRCRPSDA